MPTPGHSGWRGISLPRAPAVRIRERRTPQRKMEKQLSEEGARIVNRHRVVVEGRGKFPQSRTT